MIRTPFAAMTLQPDGARRHGPRFFCIALLTAVLAACGGGGGGGDGGASNGGDGNEADPIEVEITNATVVAGADPKELSFNWDADGDTDAIASYRLEVNPDGASGFTVAEGASDIPDTAHTQTVAVHLTDFTEAMYRIVAIDGDGSAIASSPGLGLLNNVDSEDLVGYLKAADKSLSDKVGIAVALSGDGDTLAIGTTLEAGDGTSVDPPVNDNASSSGAVYVYARAENGTWTRQAYIKASNTDPDDRFGRVIALDEDGDTLVAASLQEDGGGNSIDPPDDNAATDSGAVYVYARDEAGAWNEPTYIKASNTGSDDRFGLSVALAADGETLAVGAFLEDGSGQGVDPATVDDTATNAGAVYVYTRTAGGAWTDPVYIKAPNAEERDRFGRSVDLGADGDILAVSAVREDGAGIGVDPGDDNAASNAGAAYVYVRDDAGAWDDEAYIKATNSEAADGFGYDLALSGDGETLAVSAWRESGSGDGVDPAVDEGEDSSGAAYVYTRDDTATWSPQSYIKATNSGDDDLYGYSIALDKTGDTLAVGALRESGSGTGIDPGNDDLAKQSGAAYAYTRDVTGAWHTRSYVKASNTGLRDQFGFSVALSGDGGVLAVGALGEDGSGTGMDPTSDDDLEDSGAVYLY